MGVHVSDVILSDDDQSRDRYVTEACQHRRYKCLLQVLVWPQVVGVCGEQRAQPVARLDIRLSDKPWVRAAPVVNLFCCRENTVRTVAATADEMLGKVQPAHDRADQHE